MPPPAPESDATRAARPSQHSLRAPVQSPDANPASRSRRERDLELLARLTGFPQDSQACAHYLDEANGNVEAAVRAAVQGACLRDDQPSPQGRSL